MKMVENFIAVKSLQVSVVVAVMTVAEQDSMLNTVAHYKYKVGYRM